MTSKTSSEGSKAEESSTTDFPAPRRKGIYIGAPKCFLLELAIRPIMEAFPGQAYVVGSCLQRPDWRDIDIVQMMDDDEFAELFPDIEQINSMEFDARWLLLVTMISERLSKETGLPIDFKFQPTKWANERHKGMRSGLGLIFKKRRRR